LARYPEQQTTLSSDIGIDVVLFRRTDVKTRADPGAAVSHNP